jgi:glycine cleavage system H protein
MKLPAELKYTSTHAWIRICADGSVQVGITDHAQESLGDLVFVEGPKPGTQLTRGSACGLVESVKTASDIYAPLTGEVIAINTELQITPGKINADPYAAWIYQMKPKNPDEFVELLDTQQYQTQIDEE